MIGEIIKYSAIAAIIKSMEGKMLLYPDYEALTHKRSVAEVAAYLKGKAEYHDLLREVNESAIHRDELELFLRASLIADFAKLYRFAQADVRQFLSLFFVNFEIGVLKQIARSINTGKTFSRRLHTFVQGHVSYDVEALSRANSLPALAQALEGSRFEKPLRLLFKSREAVTIFDFEMTLDIYYYQLLSDSVQKLLKGAEKKHMMELIGSEADMLNLMWIYRSRIKLELPPELVYSYIIPMYYHIRQGDILKMANAKSQEELLAMLRQTRYTALFSGEELETAYLRVFHRLCMKMLRSDPYSLASIHCYMWLKEIEFRNIISVIESIRYGLEPEAMWEYLVVSMPREVSGHGN